MKIIPLADRVVIKTVEVEETTKGGLIPVSYTHLVMKSRLKSVAPQRDATSYVRQGSMKLTNQRDLYPVSYTHLDVYKRQERY